MSYKRLTAHTAKGLKLKKGRKFVELLSDKNLTVNALSRLAELEDKLESGELVELPCKVGDTVYVVGMYACRDKYLCKDEELERKIYDECVKNNGYCERCKYSLPYTKKFVCVQIQIESDGVWICGRNAEIYPADEIYTDEKQAEARLKELQEGNK